MSNVFDDIKNFALSPEEVGAAGVQQITSHVPLQKPSSQTFFRTQPDASWWLTTTVVFDQENFGRDGYLVLPHMRGELLGDARPVLIVPLITRQGVFQFWPLKLPLGEMRPTPWYETARQAIDLAKTRWVCVKPDVALGAYRILQAIGDIADPVWPDRSVNELLELAFRDRVIDSPDHPFVRRLRGAE